MDVAFIPPEGLYERMWEGRAGMALAPLMRRDGASGVAYRSAVIRHCELPNRYLIIDNGAAEKNMLSSDILAELHNEWRGTELVLPDALGDMATTYARATAYLSKHGRHGLSYMAVVQGKNMRELQTLVKQYFGWPRITTLGIPRLLMDNLDRAVRIDLANWIDKQYGKRFKIHLLGTNPLWVREVRFAARFAPHIRSVDTSMPYNYAIAGLKIDEARVRPVSRPLGYFANTWFGSFSEGLMKHNEDVLLRWAEGND